METSKDWREYIDRDFPAQGPITEETLAVTLTEAKRFRGSARISTGRIITDQEYEAYRKAVLNKPLP